MKAPTHTHDSSDSYTSDEEQHSEQHTNIAQEDDEDEGSSSYESAEDDDTLQGLDEDESNTDNDTEDEDGDDSTTEDTNIKPNKPTASAAESEPQHVQIQQELLPTLLKLRQSLQKPLIAANRLPNAETLKKIRNKTANLRESCNSSEDVIRSCLEDMISIRNCFSSSDENIDYTLDLEGSRKRKRSDEDLWADIESHGKSLIAHSIEVLHEAHLKTSAVSLPTTFKTFHQPMTVQIETTLANMPKLIQRTQTARFEAPIIGDSPSEIFDDGDFYTVLLRNVVDLKESSRGLEWLAMREEQRKINKKAKDLKNCDTRASKGRKIRYQVYDKLVGFMSKIPKVTWHEAKIDELFATVLRLKTNRTPPSPLDSSLSTPQLRLFA